MRPQEFDHRELREIMDHKNSVASVVRFGKRMEMLKINLGVLCGGILTILEGKNGG